MEDGDVMEVHATIDAMMDGARTDMFSFWLSDGLVKSINMESSDKKMPDDSGDSPRSKFTFELTEKGCMLIKFGQL